MSITFPSIICGVILSQQPGMLVSVNVVCKRESSPSLHYRLFVGTHVSDIVVTSGKEAGSSICKEWIITELKEVSIALKETIKSRTERKISIDNLFLTLSTRKEDEDVADGNEDVAASGNDEEIEGNEYI